MANYFSVIKLRMDVYEKESSCCLVPLLKFNVDCQIVYGTDVCVCVFVYLFTIYDVYVFRWIFQPF